MRTLLPRRLRPGGTIGIVAPASPYDRKSDVLRGIAWWEAHGFRVVLADGALERGSYVAGPPERRAADLVAMFERPDIDAIQCLRGGYGSAQTIPHIDFEVVARNPKPFIGFSDITALHAALGHFTGLVTFYGPTLTSLGPRVSDLTASRMIDVLCGSATGPLPADEDDPFLQTLAPGRASGRLAGGCLSDLVHTMGTPWEIDLDGALFFFEEVGAGPHSIDRALLQLEQAGKLRSVRGIAIGRLAGCEWNDAGGSPWPHTSVLEEMLEDRLAPLDVPVLYRLPFGHGSHLATIPIGVAATLDANEGRLVIDEPALCDSTRVE